ncbi:hypothetical protein [Anthocerotibacter panamensis]|uniref:hypothetical protein n=1 Tax=Anthocerotibacter panamensis TaxID=2857077 RepID=UPI001C40308C|nr:hypothetical protein [Anthocerotibacter panamensis]
MLLATTSPVAADGSNLAVFLFFVGLFGLLIAVCIHVLQSVISKEGRLLKSINSFLAGLIVTVALSLTVSFIVGDGGKSIVQAVLASAGVAPTASTALSLQHLRLLEEP